MSLIDQVCVDFATAAALLKGTYKNPYPADVALAIQEAILFLEATYRPLLDAYYAGDICKELYTNVREYRQNALAFLAFSLELLNQFPNDPCVFGEVDTYIRKAVENIEKAEKLLCDSNSCSSSCSSSCSRSCEASSFTSESCETSTCSSDSCESSSCSDSSCESSCESSSCSTVSCHC